MKSTLTEIEFYRVEMVAKPKDESVVFQDDEEPSYNENITKDWCMIDWNDVQMIDPCTDPNTLGTNIYFKNNNSIICTYDYELMKLEWQKSRLYYFPNDN